MNIQRLLIATVLITTMGALGMSAALAQPAVPPGASPGASQEDLQPAVQTSDALGARASTGPAASAPAPGADTPPPHATQAATSHASAAKTLTTKRAPVAAAQGPAASKASDRIELGTTQISGNRELPKLLYVVPWRRDALGDFAGRPPNSLVDEALTPVDRAVFQRQNRYYAALQASPPSAKSQPDVTGGPAASAHTKDEK